MVVGGWGEVGEREREKVRICYKGLKPLGLSGQPDGQAGRQTRDHPALTPALFLPH